MRKPNSSTKSLGLTGLLLLFTLVCHQQLVAQSASCSPPSHPQPGFVTAGSFTGCTMQYLVTYECPGFENPGPHTITCNIDAGNGGVSVEGGCCIVSVQVTTPQQGYYTVSSSPGVTVTPGSWIMGSPPCDHQSVSNIEWHFPEGNCVTGTITVQ